MLHGETSKGVRMNDREESDRGLRSRVQASPAGSSGAEVGLSLAKAPTPKSHWLGAKDGGA